MSIVGFNFKKINVEKKEDARGKINIKNNVTIKDIQEVDFSFGSEKQNALRVIFEFVSSYEPMIGNIELGGDLLLMENPKKSKDILSQWKKEKKVDKDVMALILNTTLSKCNIQALILSQQVNLPPPVPLPKVQIEGKK